MPKRKTPPTSTTLFVRNFPWRLSRAVRAAAILHDVTVSEMLARVVEAGLPAVQPPADQNTAALTSLRRVRRAARAAGIKA